MNFYRWMMNRGASILFIASLVIFVISFVGGFLEPTNLSNPPEAGPSLSRLWFLISTFATAVSKSALTFFGACFLYRLDAAWFGGKAPK